MKSCSIALANHLKEPTTTITTMWKITRLDSNVYTFTEHDRDLTYQGLVYKSTGGFNKSSIKSTGTFSVDGMEVNGFLSDDTIPDDELRNGAFDYAEVEVFIVNYMDLSMGEMKMRYGHFGEVRSAPSGMFLVELRGLIQQLTSKIGETYVPECKADLGDHRCKVKLFPELYRSNTIYRAGDRVIFPIEANDTYVPTVALDVKNHDFETDGLKPSNGFNDGWARDLTSAQIVSGTINLDPYLAPGADPDSNTKYCLISMSVARISQRLSLIKGAATPVTIANGCSLRFRMMAASYEPNSRANVQFFFTTAANGNISNTTREVELHPNREWQPVDLTVPIPTNAAYVRVYIGPTTSDPMTWEAIAVDDIIMEVELQQLPDAVDTFADYGGVEFQAQGTGRSGTVTPAFSGDINDTVVDGTVTWKTVAPTHMFKGRVSENATLSTQIKIDLIDSYDNQFDWGVISFLSGDNIGRRVEVQSYNRGTGIMTFVMPVPYPCKTGDMFAVHTGCDKSREVCFSRFANIINFRAEPDVPGMNQYFKVGGMT